MGLNTLNFIGKTAPYDNSGLENLPMKLLAAYQMPMKMQQEEEDRALKKKLIEAKTAYLGRMPGNKGEDSYKPQTDAAKRLYDAENARIKFGEDSEEYKALRAAAPLGKNNYQGEYGEKFKDTPLEYHGIDLSAETPGERQQAYKRMSEETERAKEMVKTKNSLAEMRKIVEKYPDLSHSFWGAIDSGLSAGDPNVFKSALKSVLRKFDFITPKDERVAREEMEKIGSSFIMSTIASGKSGSGRAFSDMYKQIIKNSKPEPGKEGETNLNIIDRMNEELGEPKIYLDELEWGRRNKKDVFENTYINKQRAALLNSENAVSKKQSTQSGETQKEIEPGIFVGRIRDPQTGDYKIVKVRKENVAAFRSKGGDLID